MAVTLHELDELIDNLKPDPWGWNGTLVKQTTTHAVLVVPMLWNDRVILLPLDAPKIYDHGWCYDRGEYAALMAALVWEPDTEPEPQSFKKRVGGLRILG